MKVIGSMFFDANWVQLNQDLSTTDQWNHIQTKVNPWDDASHGLSPNVFMALKWSKGPAFIWQNNGEWPIDEKECMPDPNQVLPCDPKVKKITVLVTSAAIREVKIEEHLDCFSDWFHVKRAIAWSLLYLKTLQEQVSTRRKGRIKRVKPQIQNFQEAENVIIKSVPSTAFPEEVSLQKATQDVTPPKDKSSAPIREVVLTKNSTLRKLDPFVEPRGGMTLNKMRADGCWIITGRKEVRSYIWRCVVCRKLHSSVVEQKMANLPEDHLEPIAASTDDYCGPFTIREGKKEMKGYRVVFTSLASRTIHHNTSSKLETDAFINALHHLICQRGQIQFCAS